MPKASISVPSLASLSKKDPFGKEKTAKKKAQEMFKNQELESLNPIDRLMNRDQDEEDEINNMINKVLGDKENTVDKLAYSGAG